MNNKIDIRSTAKKVKHKLVKESPKIMFVMGIAGFYSACALAVTATPKALEAIDKEIERKNNELSGFEDSCTQLEPLEVVKVTWKYYIPTFAMITIATGCIIGAYSVNIKRNAALATAYTLSEAALKEYKDKMIETVGEEKAEEIKQSILKDKVTKRPVDSETLHNPNNGDVLCLDTLSGRYFYSNKNKLDSAVNEINRMMRNETYISLNTFYDQIGLDDVAIGELLGWHIDEGYLDIHYGSVVMDDGTLYMVLEYHVAPMYDYDRMY